MFNEITCRDCGEVYPDGWIHICPSDKRTAREILEDLFGSDEHQSAIRAALAWNTKGEA